MRPLRYSINHSKASSLSGTKIEDALILGKLVVVARYYIKLLAEAREIFERLEAKPWLERAAGVGPEQAAQVPA